MPKNFQIDDEFISFDSVDNPDDKDDVIRMERAIWRAVITQAFTDLRSNAKKPMIKKAKIEAIEWIFNGGEDFDAVCLNAGYEPEIVREKAESLISDPNFKVE